VSGVLFPLHEAAKRHDSVAVRKRLEVSQWWSRARIEAEQLARLRRFLLDIGTNVPYYRQLLAERSLDPASLRSVGELRALPLLTKAEIRAHASRMLAEGHGPVTRYNTGGSSGEPLVFLVGKARKSHDVGAKWRVTRWWGVDVGDREAVVWGSPIELGAQDRVKAVRDMLLRTFLLPAFEMSDARVNGFIETLRLRRPRMLFGYPSALSHIASHAEARGVDLRGLGVKVAFVTSERLYEHQRQSIERVFGCPVANGYGGRDAGFIAHECPSGSMHLMAEDIVVELVDEHGEPVAPGQPGEIVVTHTATGDFPFVRYRTGDLAVLDTQPCPCGRGLPVLKEIQGRSTDFVVAADGTVMHGLALIYILRDLPGLRRFKIIQHSLLSTEILIEPDGGYLPNMDLIVEAFKQRLGESVDVRLRLVHHMPPERSGKFRYVVSHVDAAAGASKRPACAT
jgi:phenylacetate-CoA ligase